MRLGPHYLTPNQLQLISSILVFRLNQAIFV